MEKGSEIKAMSEEQKNKLIELALNAMRKEITTAVNELSDKKPSYDQIEELFSEGVALGHHLTCGVKEIFFDVVALSRQTYAHNGN